MFDIQNNFTRYCPEEPVQNCALKFISVKLGELTGHN